eukprot:TRINITY_DN945_c0_g1_i1.p1 TRINITY_DN945_c0_g1~~TRINITY_DN945_c0_g1_i1.p1  ORF type:complete len:972 (+),score=277.93 TRINITY_DN945_c0_g1_i1:26-2917(+)
MCDCCEENNFEPHPFNPNICKNCRHTKKVHGIEKVEEVIHRYWYVGKVSDENLFLNFKTLQELKQIKLIDAKFRACCYFCSFVGSNKATKYAYSVLFPEFSKTILDSDFDDEVFLVEWPLKLQFQHDFLGAFIFSGKYEFLPNISYGSSLYLRFFTHLTPVILFCTFEKPESTELANSIANLICSISDQSLGFIKPFIVVLLLNEPDSIRDVGFFTRRFTHIFDKDGYFSSNSSLLLIPCQSNGLSADNVQYFSKQLDKCQVLFRNHHIPLNLKQMINQFIWTRSILFDVDTFSPPVPYLHLQLAAELDLHPILNAVVRVVVGMLGYLQEDEFSVAIQSGIYLLIIYSLIVGEMNIRNLYGDLLHFYNLIMPCSYQLEDQSTWCRQPSFAHSSHCYGLTYYVPDQLNDNSNVEDFCYSDELAELMKNHSLSFKRFGKGPSCWEGCFEEEFESAFEELGNMFETTMTDLEWADTEQLIFTAHETISYACWPSDPDDPNQPFRILTQSDDMCILCGRNYIHSPSGVDEGCERLTCTCGHHFCSECLDILVKDENCWLCCICMEEICSSDGIHGDSVESNFWECECPKRLIDAPSLTQAIDNIKLCEKLENNVFEENKEPTTEKKTEEETIVELENNKKEIAQKKEKEEETVIPYEDATLAENLVKKKLELSGMCGEGYTAHLEWEFVPDGKVKHKLLLRWFAQRGKKRKVLKKVFAPLKGTFDFIIPPQASDCKLGANFDCCKKFNCENDLTVIFPCVVEASAPEFIDFSLNFEGYSSSLLRCNYIYKGGNPGSHIFSIQRNDKVIFSSAGSLQYHASPDDINQMLKIVAIPVSSTQVKGEPVECEVMVKIDPTYERQINNIAKNVYAKFPIHCIQTGNHCILVLDGNKFQIIGKDGNLLIDNEFSENTHMLSLSSMRMGLKIDDEVVFTFRTVNTAFPLDYIILSFRRFKNLVLYSKVDFTDCE